MEGLCTSTRDAPPTHFMLKIEGFSSLSSSSKKRYESRKFDAGGYKWKLAIYPNGNKKKDVEEEDHISLYLVSDKSCLNLKKDILVTYSLFAYDHSRDKYMEVQELSRFHSLKSESGFDKFLSHKIINDPTNGYLMNDSCVFGAEVFVINSTTTRGQCLSMMPENTIPISYTWKIKNFSKLQDKFYYSDKFTALGHDWKIKCYPRGKESNSLFLSLELDTPESRLPPGMDVLVECKLRVVNQVNIENHVEGKFTRSFNASDSNWGWHSFMDLSILNKKNGGYLVKDKCILEAEVRLLGSAKNWV